MIDEGESVTCLKCGSVDLQGSGRGHAQRLAGPGGQAAYQFDKVRFTCHTCGHWWTEDSPKIAGKDQGLSWEARSDLRQAAQAKDGKIRRWDRTRRGVDELVRAGLLERERVTAKRTAIYRITEAGRRMAGTLPNDEDDLPLGMRGNE